MKPKPKNNTGFSIIELLFAMAFLSVIVFGVIKLQTSQLIIGNTQQNRLRANVYAMQGLEVISALYADLAAANCSQETPCALQNNNPYSLQEGNKENLDDLFERYFVKENLTNGYLVRAFVDWEDSSGMHSVEAKRVAFE